MSGEGFDKFGEGLGRGVLTAGAAVADRRREAQQQAQFGQSLGLQRDELGVRKSTADSENAVRARQLGNMPTPDEARRARVQESNLRSYQIGDAQARLDAAPDLYQGQANQAVGAGQTALAGGAVASDLAAANVEGAQTANKLTGAKVPFAGKLAGAEASRAESEAELAKIHTAVGQKMVDQKLLSGDLANNLAKFQNAQMMDPKNVDLHQRMLFANVKNEEDKGKLELLTHLIPVLAARDQSDVEFQNHLGLAKANAIATIPHSVDASMRDIANVYPPGTPQYTAEYNKRTQAHTAAISNGYDALSVADPPTREALGGLISQYALNDKLGGNQRDALALAIGALAHSANGNTPESQPAPTSRAAGMPEASPATASRPDKAGALRAKQAADAAKQKSDAETALGLPSSLNAQEHRNMASGSGLPSETSFTEAMKNTDYRNAFESTGRKAITVTVDKAPKTIGLSDNNALPKDLQEWGPQFDRYVDSDPKAAKSIEELYRKKYLRGGAIDESRLAQLKIDVLREVSKERPRAYHAEEYNDNTLKTAIYNLTNRGALK